MRWAAVGARHYQTCGDSRDVTVAVPLPVVILRVKYLLTNENGTRPLKTRDELVADLKVLGFEVETEQLDLVLEVLVGSGLVFLVPDCPANRYQLVHDYLVAFIRQQQAPGLLAELAEAKEKQKLTEAQLRQALSVS